MSLAKRKELADIRAKNEKVSNEIVAVYTRLKTAATQVAKTDFIKFFRANGFTVTEAPDTSFFHNQPQGILASYEKMTVRFADEQKNDTIVLESTITGTNVKYVVHIVIDNPKAESPSIPNSWMVPREEDKKLEQEFDHAQKRLTASEATKTGLSESKAMYSVTVNSTAAGQQGNKSTHYKEQQLTLILEKLFN